MGTEGIDVAWPQGAHYGWHQWEGKIGFGMCKATEGRTLADPDFADNWNAMWELDRMMPRFAYHVLDFSDDPEAQAEFCVAAVKAHGLLPGDNLVLDVSDGSLSGLTPAAAAALGVRFLHAANAAAPGHRVLIYTDVAFALAGGCAGMAAWYLWLAEYSVTAPQVPAPWSAWTFWQRSDNGIDLDAFNGDEAHLLAFCRMPDKR
ncbi:MAG: glycoside hydrolase family 25 protein [Streptosporangiaceae bacterium]